MVVKTEFAVELDMSYEGKSGMPLHSAGRHIREGMKAVGFLVGALKMDFYEQPQHKCHCCGLRIDERDGIVEVAAGYICQKCKVTLQGQLKLKPTPTHYLRYVDPDDEPKIEPKTCPKCHTELHWNYKHIGKNLGIEWENCPDCDYEAFIEGYGITDGKNQEMI